MEKIDITISFDAEKMDAVKIYLKKEETTVQKKLDEAMRQLYEQTVPEAVREYLDAKNASPPSVPPGPASPRPPRRNPCPRLRFKKRRAAYERRCTAGALASRV